MRNGPPKISAANSISSLSSSLTHQFCLDLLTVAQGSFNNHQESMDGIKLRDLRTFDRYADLPQREETR